MKIGIGRFSLYVCIGFEYSWELIKRSMKHLWQKITRGFSDKEVWNLQYEIMKYTLPRLKRLRELTCGVPGCIIDPEGKMSFEDAQAKWHGIIDEMIFGIEYYMNDDYEGEDIEKCEKRAHEGLKLFGEYLPNLWW